MIIASHAGLQTTTSYKVVLPFYLYAAVAFLLSCMLLFLSTDAFQQHYFNPQTLAITHLMALGWGTMIILGASHQLVPVIIEGKLYSNMLAYASFFLAGAGIPLLVFGFYTFNMGWPSISGGIAINFAVMAYLLNLVLSMLQTKSKSVYQAFIVAATTWLLLTTLAGLLLVINFSFPFLNTSSLTYLPVHAHMGIAGWFLLLVTGVGSRLIPMFLISKYTNKKLLWTIFGCINLSLLLFVASELCSHHDIPFFIPALLVGTGILLFGLYCRKAYLQRIRKQVDNPMKVSLLSIVLSLFPPVLLIVIISYLYYAGEPNQLVLLYGFCIFFGWLTAIILGMTFKTLPFIVWNKVYHIRSGADRTPSPKDLFSDQNFRWMAINYLAGFAIFATGLVLKINLLLQAGAAFLILAALLYNLNIIKIIRHKAVQL